MTASGRFLLLSVGILSCWLGFVATAADLEGRVLELRSSSPVAQAQVSVLPLAKGGHAMTAETGEDGGFRITAMTPGAYRIDVSKQGYAASSRFFTYVENDAALIVRVPKDGAIQGTITSSNGEPAMGADVVALTKVPGTPEFGRTSAVVRFGTQADDQGHYRLSDLPPGVYVVAVSYSGTGTTAGSTATLFGDDAAPRVFPVLSGEAYEDANLTLTPEEAHSLEGQVTPHPAKGPVVVTLAPRVQPGIIAAQTLTDGAGRFRIESVHPGRYLVLAAGPSDPQMNGGLGGVLVGDALFGRAEVEIANQDEKAISIAMQPGGRAVFHLSGAGPSFASGPCGGTAALELTAIEDWGATLDRQTQLKSGPADAVAGIAPARYLVTLSGLPEGCYYLGEPVLDFTAGVPAVVEIPRGPGVSIEGKLIGAGGAAPLPSIVLLQAESPAEGEPALRMVETGPEGAFTLGALRPGNYRALAISPAQWASSQWRLDVQQMVPVKLTGGVVRLELPVPPPSPQ